MSTQPLWWDTAAPRVRYTGEVPFSADVVIVGGGFTGLWSAYYLLEHQPDLSVLVLEAEHVGFGASGRNGGWVSALWPVGVDVVAQSHGRDAALDLMAALRETVDEVGRVCGAESIDAGFAKGGTLSIARSPPSPRGRSLRWRTPRSGGWGRCGSIAMLPASDSTVRRWWARRSTHTVPGSILGGWSTVWLPPSPGGER